MSPQWCENTKARTDDLNAITTSTRRDALSKAFLNKIHHEYSQDGSSILFPSNLFHIRTGLRAYRTLFNKDNRICRYGFVAHQKLSR